MSLLTVQDFNFSLPTELIAQRPLSERSASRLLYVPCDGSVQDQSFSDVLGWLKPNDLLVLNDTKVIPARLYGRKPTGGQFELLIERLLPNQEVLVHLKVSKKPAIGGRLLFDDGIEAEMLGRDGELFHLRWLTDQDPLVFLQKIGHLPLPPYIERPDTVEDQDRYQTVFSAHYGAVAAPTAGLHFTQSLLDQVRDKGVLIHTLTLHVGAGTFQPVRVDRIEDHVMHFERYQVSQALVDAIAKTQANGGRVIAVGTTVVRALETAALSGVLTAGSGDTNIFITPGFHFRVIDALITNFHLPQSTLLMLVSGFSGFNRIRSAYRHAIEHGYRFFSYGDAMLLEKCRQDKSS